MSRPRCFLELPAGLAAVSLRLHGGKHCRPPISRMGNKAGYADAILDALGLRSGQGADAYLWAEADPDVRALLRAYPDASMLTRIAEIIRGWADEEPRALWERLRAERKARGPQPVEVDCAAEMLFFQHGSFSGKGPQYGIGRPEGGPAGNMEHLRPSLDIVNDAVTSLAAYATIAASNRLINVAGPDLMNTGAGGTTFGGEEFATPAGDVAAGFERVAGWLTVGAGSFKACEPESGWHGLHLRRPNDDGYRPNREGLARACDAVARPSRWPSVAVLPSIPTAADVARWLGTPGDLSGCVVYADPPYAGTTGYGSNLTRDEVIAYARDFDALGAVVCISEAEPLTALGWEATAITGGRRGQKRTFSRQQEEYLTMNRPPAAVVATQMGMFK